jgi:16S rRNA (adenine1518-N6/adenine1519-N6)-dimethyltransferase
LSLPHIRPKKSLGQHFLHDENIARKIVAAIRPGQTDVMLEIGPGEGMLTKHLVGKVERLIAVEIDSRAVVRLKEMLSSEEAEILHADFLKVNIASLQKQTKKPLRIVGNIPYHITSPVLFRVLDDRTGVQDVTLMIQKEVASRIVARPGTKDYGILSVVCQLFADVKKLFDVSPNAFFPKPRVMSSVIQLVLLDKPRFPLNDQAFFRAMVRSVFGKRRKTLRNSLQYFLAEQNLPLPPSDDLQRRPESLSVEELVLLSNTILAGGDDKSRN